MKILSFIMRIMHILFIMSLLLLDERLSRFFASDIQT
jgi:hypothetical protein